MPSQEVAYMACQMRECSFGRIWVVGVELFNAKHAVASSTISWNHTRS